MRNKLMSDREIQIKMIAEFYLNEYNLSDYKIKFRLMRGSVGNCSTKRKLITLSSYYTETKPFMYMVNTILHEIAHALTPGHRHDLVWREKAAELGIAPRANKLTQQRYNERLKDALR